MSWTTCQSQNRSSLSLSTVKHIRREHLRLFNTFLLHVVNSFCSRMAHFAPEGQKNPPQLPEAEWSGIIKLLHVTPAVLQSMDGRLTTRQHRYEGFAPGDLVMMLACLVSFAKTGHDVVGAQ